MHKPFKPKRLRRPPPSLPSVPAICVVSFNTAKSQNTPASIVHFLNEGYDIILLQELSPLLPQRYTFGNDRAKVFSNVCGHKHGVSVIAGPRIARYTSCVPPRDSDGLICGAKIPLPEATRLHVFSVYSPPVRTGAPAPYPTPYSEFLLLISTIIPITSWGVMLTAFWIPNVTSTAWSIYMSGTGSRGGWNTSHLGWWTLSGQSTPPSGSIPPTQATAETAKQGRITSLRPLTLCRTFPFWMCRSSRTTPSLTTTQWLRSSSAPPRSFCLSPHSPLAFFGSFLVTKSNNSPTAYGLSPTGAGTSRTPLPGPHWKRSSPPLILSLCRLGLRTTKSCVRNRSARTKRATASSENHNAHPRLLLPRHFPSTLRKFSPW